MSMFNLVLSDDYEKNYFGPLLENSECHLMFLYGFNLTYKNAIYLFIYYILKLLLFSYI